MHFDWNGTPEELEAFTDTYKKIAETMRNLKFIGRMAPMNKKYHFTLFMEFKDWKTFQKMGEKWFAENTRSYEKLTHAEYEFYS